MKCAFEHKVSHTTVAMYFPLFLMKKIHSFWATEPMIQHKKIYARQDDKNSLNLFENENIVIFLKILDSFESASK